MRSGVVPETGLKKTANGTGLKYEAGLKKRASCDFNGF